RPPHPSKRGHDFPELTTRRSVVHRLTARVLEWLHGEALKVPEAIECSRHIHAQCVRQRLKLPFDSFVICVVNYRLGAKDRGYDPIKAKRSDEVWTLVDLGRLAVPVH